MKPKKVIERFFENLFQQKYQTVSFCVIGCFNCRHHLKKKIEVWVCLRNLHCLAIFDQYRNALFEENQLLLKSHQKLLLYRAY